MPSRSTLSQFVSGFLWWVAALRRLEPKAARNDISAYSSIKLMWCSNLPVPVLLPLMHAISEIEPSMMKGSCYFLYELQEFLRDHQQGT
jgi:hypothetical protein